MTDAKVVPVSPKSAAKKDAAKALIASTLAFFGAAKGVQALDSAHAADSTATATPDVSSASTVAPVIVHQLVYVDQFGNEYTQPPAVDIVSDIPATVATVAATTTTIAPAATVSAPAPPTPAASKPTATQPKNNTPTPTPVATQAPQPQPTQPLPPPAPVVTQPPAPATTQPAPACSGSQCP